MCVFADSCTSETSIYLFFFFLSPLCNITKDTYVKWYHHHLTHFAVLGGPNTVTTLAVLSFIFETNIHLTNYDIFPFQAYPSIHLAESRERSWKSHQCTTRQSHWCSLLLVWILDHWRRPTSRERPWRPNTGPPNKCITPQVINSVSWGGCLRHTNASITYLCSCGESMGQRELSHRWRPWGEVPEICASVAASPSSSPSVLMSLRCNKLLWSE